MTTPATPPTDPPCGKAAGSAGRTNSGAATPKGWWQKAAGLWPAMSGRAPQGVPSILDPADGRFEAHTIRTPAVRQSKSKAELMQ